MFAAATSICTLGACTAECLSLRAWLKWWLQNIAGTDVADAVSSHCYLGIRDFFFVAFLLLLSLTIHPFYANAFESRRISLACCCYRSIINTYTNFIFMFSMFLSLGWLTGTALTASHCYCRAVVLFGSFRAPNNEINIFCRGWFVIIVIRIVARKEPKWFSVHYYGSSRLGRLSWLEYVSTLIMICSPQSCLNTHGKSCM